MPRAFILVLDSVGIGGAPDAAQFGDAGANTVGHIATACAEGKADRAGLRQGPLHLPHLVRLGLGEAALAACGETPANMSGTARPAGAYGFATEISRGKDTPSGHWEIAGLPVDFDWGHFPDQTPAFPGELTADLIAQGDIPGILGNCHASGTEIIARLGEAHVETGQPICYTSADSVFQIAAHETHFGLERLYRFCEIAKTLTEPYTIGRVIARPFVGESRTTFTRTGNRRDYTTPPHGLTLLDHCVAAGRQVISIGKIADIFAHRAISQKIKTGGNDATFDAVMEEADNAPEGALVFANFVDFDSLYGHRRNVAGYAAALEAFDARLPVFENTLTPGDLAIITADHGCDPTWSGTDHTREAVPVLCFGAIAPQAIGRRDTFADIGQTAAKHLALRPLEHGVSFL